MLDGFFRSWAWNRPQQRISEGNHLVDLAGRLKISQPLILLNANLTLGKSELTWDEVVSGAGASSTWLSTDVCVDMAVSANNEYVIRQTRSRFNYQAGKPQRIDATGILCKAPGVISRIGSFSSNFTAPYTPDRGVYFEANDNVVYVCENKNGVVNRVAQSAWNCDHCDGTGPSGQTIDWSAFHLFSIEYEWLGAGDVRYSIMLDGTWVTLHVSKHSGQIGSVYMRNGTLPVRYEIRSIGGAGTMRQQCASVISDGGDPNFGIVGSVDNDGSTISVGVGVIRPILSVRITPDPDIACHQAHVLSAYLMNSAQSTRYLWSIGWDPTIVGTPNWVTYPYSCLDTWIGTGAETVSGGSISDAGYADSSLRITKSDTKTALGLGHTIAGVPDIITLCVESVSGTCTISGGMQARQVL